MSFSAFLRRATNSISSISSIGSIKFWTASKKPTVPAAPDFQIDEVAERVARLQAPKPQEPAQMHSLVKLTPIPVPRSVRWEMHAVYLGAWAGTAAMAWGSYQIPTDWLLWYGAAAVGIFAVLFRLEGPLTRAERHTREAAVARNHTAYQHAEAHLKEVLNERFNERMAEFQTMRRLYEQALHAIQDVEATQPGPLLARLAGSAHDEKSREEELAEQVDELEARMIALVDELEDFSDIHKEEIDAAIMARHNARLAYWQTRFDEAILTGITVQQH